MSTSTMNLSRGTVAFVEAEETLHRPFDLGRQLPSQVFRGQLTDYCWTEFEDVLTDQFWACLAECARLAGDRRLFVVCPDPDVETNFGHTGVSVYERSDSASRYHEFLDAALSESPEVSLRNVAVRILYVGESASWAFWADRQVEVAVGAHRGGMMWPLIRGIRYQTFDGMLQLVSGPYRGNLPAKLEQDLESNYRARTWPLQHYVEG